MRFRPSHNITEIYVLIGIKESVFKIWGRRCEGRELIGRHLAASNHTRIGSPRIGGSSQQSRNDTSALVSVSRRFRLHSTNYIISKPSSHYIYSIISTAKYRSAFFIVHFHWAKRLWVSIFEIILMTSLLWRLQSLAVQPNFNMKVKQNAKYHMTAFFCA